MGLLVSLGPHSHWCNAATFGVLTPLELMPLKLPTGGCSRDTLLWGVQWPSGVITAGTP